VQSTHLKQVARNNPVAARKPWLPQLPSLDAIVLQLQTASAQLQALSTLPMSQQEGEIQNAIEEVKSKITALEEQVNILSIDVQLNHLFTDKRIKVLEAVYVMKSSFHL
jgi:hypothetical protein